MSQSDHFQENKNSEDMANSLIFQQMYPKVRACDPRAYFRAKLSSLKETREVLFGPEEYEEERERILKAITNPDKRDLIMNVIILFFIFAGLLGIAYGIFLLKDWGFICFIPMVLAALWFLHGQRKYYHWLNSLTYEQRTEIIQYLRRTDLISEKEQMKMLTELKTQK